MATEPRQRPARPPCRPRWRGVAVALSFVLMMVSMTAWFITGFWDYDLALARDQGRLGYTRLVVAAGVVEFGHATVLDADEWGFERLTRVPAGMAWRYRWRFVPMVDLNGWRAAPHDNWAWIVRLPLWCTAVLGAVGIVVGVRWRARGGGAAGGAK